MSDVAALKEAAALAAKSRLVMRVTRFLATGDLVPRRRYGAPRVWMRALVTCAASACVWWCASVRSATRNVPTGAQR